MDEDSSPLLSRMVTDSPPPAEGRRDLKDTLQQLNINSVFDIAQLSKTEFAEQVARHNDDDTTQLHFKACSAAAQLETLFREQQVSPDPGASAKPGSGVTYNALFQEDWQQFCAPNSIAAVDSPVAYLRALYLFAMQLEKHADANTATRLTKRRPDLKDLLIDPHSVSGQRPMLSIINQTLLDNLGVGDQKAACQLLSVTWYPFSLPYHFHHQQCLLGLAENALSLGELNYRISRRLPVARRDAHAYGYVTVDNDDLQPLLSGLSPEQQALLKQQWAGPTYDTQQVRAFYLDYYNWRVDIDQAGPAKVTDFLHHTGLNAEQLQVLLAQTTHTPRRSPYCKKVPDRAYGAAFINGPSGTAISQGSTHPARLVNVTLERFDRLQRMIRLQRWLDLPFAQLDTLLISAMRCESDANPDLLITHNTLRALGVYRYLNKRYGLQAEEFAALLHHLPVDASGERVSLFDQVFNRADSALPPLYLDGRPFDATTRQQLCASLGLQDSPTSLQLLIGADEAPERNLATISSIYRQARVARLFGLSILDFKHLLDILRHASYQHQLLKPTLRKALKGPPDVLDVLLHLDWASRWISENGSSLELLRHQLLRRETVSLDPAVALLLKAFSGHPQRSLSDRLSAHTFPVQPENDLAIDWEAALHSALQRIRQGTSRSIALDRVLATLKLSNQNDGVPQAKKTLLLILDSVQQDLQPLYQRLTQILQNLPQEHGNHANPVKYGHADQVLRLFRPTTATGSALHTLSYLILLLPHAADLLQLPVSRQALHALLANPHWLNDAYHVDALLELSLHNVFLMQQFKHCIDRYGVSQEQLLDYLRHANTAPAPPDAEANQRLAQLLGWNASEIEALSQSLQPPRITSIERLDWILRCRQASADTGLSANQLLELCRLDSQSTFEAWQAVGEAVTSTHP